MNEVMYVATGGELLDAVCFRHYGHTAGRVEAVLDANPGLAAQGPFLPSGTRVRLPDLKKPAQAPAVAPASVALWD